MKFHENASLIANVIEGRQGITLGNMNLTTAYLSF